MLGARIPKIKAAALPATAALTRLKSELKSKKLGRGGHLATAGRGRKGWKARHGKNRIIPAFAGGQTTILKAFRKFGIQHRAALLAERQNLRPLSLDTIQHWINRKRIDPDKIITIKEIAQSNIAGKLKDGVALIAYGAGSLTSKINIQVNRASPAAIEIIQSLGGTVTTVYNDSKTIHALLNPLKYVHIPKVFIPNSRKMLARYMDKTRMGFLVPHLEGLPMEKFAQCIKRVANSD